MKPSCTLAAFRALPVLVAVVVASSVPGRAQTTTPTLTALSSFERTISLSGVLTTLAPTISPDVLASITSGAVDFREQVNYNPGQGILVSTYFVVQAGSPTPTNLPLLPASSIVASTTLRVDRVYVGTSPTPSVMLVGVIFNSSGTPYGSFAGAPATYSFGYTAGTPPTVSNVVETLAGTAVLYSSTAAGNFTVNQPGGGGPPAGTITISLSGPNGPIGSNNILQTVGSNVTITATATSTNPGALTYSWTANSGYTPIAALGVNTPSLSLQFAVHQTSVWTLTVTDATGLTASVTVTVQFI